jgi:hypothetical protein
MGQTSPTIRSYIKFNVSGLSGTVTSAKLKLFPNSTSPVGFQVHGAASSSWDENSITWNNAPAMGSTVVASSGAYSCCSGYITTDATPLVTGNGYVTTVITSTNTTADLYRAREWGSSYTPLLVVTTGSGGDVSVPSVPVGLSAVAGDGRVALSWGASSDNVGVAGYRVYRNGSQVSSTASLSYTDSGLSNGTSYSYTVAAYDAAGNVSAPSAAVTATPTATAPPPPPPPGSAYWVSTAGSDANPGTQTQPWRTVNHAASAASPGSTVVIMGGSYGEDVKLSTSGATASPTTFQANGADTVTVRSLNLAANHLAVSGLTITGASSDCVSIQPALSDITLQGSKINNCGRDGIHFVRSTTQPYTNQVLIKNNAITTVGKTNSSANDLTAYANYLTVEGNDLTGTPNDAIDLWGDHHTYRANNIHDITNTNGNHNDAFQTWGGYDDGYDGNPVTNLLLERNKVVNVLGANAHAFMLEGPGNNVWTVRDNVFSNIGSIGLVLGVTGSGESSTGLAIYNNTFVNAGSNDAVEFNSADTGSFVNNIVQGGGGLYITRGTTVKEDYNVFSGTSSNVALGSHDKSANPLFVGVSIGDFHLGAGSPAINGGDNGTLVPLRPYDFDGKPVVNVVDVGAYEYQG